jgi:hypothetical protein
MVMNTSLALILKASIAIFLIYRLYILVFRREQTAYFPFEKLGFQAKKWYFQNKDGATLHYDKIAVILEAGIFFLLECSMLPEPGSSKIKTKVYLVFFDQINREDYRILRLLEKIT